MAKIFWLGSFVDTVYN